MIDILIGCINWIDKVFISPLIILISTDLPFAVVGAGMAFCYLYFKKRESSVGIIRKLFSARVWFHRSSALDLKINLFNLVFYTLILIYIYEFGVYFSEHIYLLLNSMFGKNTWPYSRLSAALCISAILFFVSEFVIYWVHRLQHTTPILWRFHMRHHSAQVLTPMTRGRTHPFALLLVAPINVFFTHLVGGITWYVIGGQFGEMKVLTVNIFAFLGLLLGGSLTHSHVFLRFPSWLSEILISPAMHQIHHSRSRKHYNCNYGNFLSIWDNLFNTLYVPKKDERLAFGIQSKEGHTQDMKGFLFGRYSERWSWKRLTNKGEPRDNRRNRSS